MCFLFYFYLFIQYFTKYFSFPQISDIFFASKNEFVGFGLDRSSDSALINIFVCFTSKYF